MAVLIDGQLVSNKVATKKKAPTKDEKTKSAVGKTGWWIEKSGAFPLYEGVIIKETPTTFIIDSYSRNFVEAGNSNEDRVVDKQLFTFQELENIF